MTAAPATQHHSGFAEPVFDAQATFRAIMDALANPGRIVTIEAAPDRPQSLGPALAAAALTLLDHDTRVFLGAAFARNDEVAAFLSFRTGCRFTEEPASADFALIGDPRHCPALSRFAQGTLEYPDRSTTLLLEVERLDADLGFVLEGPGIKGSRKLGVAPLPGDFAGQLKANRERFPQGVDLILCAADRLAGLPRSIKITE